MARFFGFNAPFLGGNEKVLSRQVDDRLLKNDLLQLLLTAPGERVMRPDFGTGIRTFLFDPIDASGLAELRSNIRDAIERFDRRINVTQIKFDINEELLIIKIFGSFSLDRFDAPGGLAEETDLLLELKIPTATSGNQIG